MNFPGDYEFSLEDAAPSYITRLQSPKAAVYIYRYIGVITIPIHITDTELVWTIWGS